MGAQEVERKKEMTLSGIASVSQRPAKDPPAVVSPRVSTVVQEGQRLHVLMTRQPRRDHLASSNEEGKEEKIHPKSTSQLTSAS